MKKLLKKKVNVFGKGIPVFAIVLLSLALVSAALITSWGVITGLVTVNQGLRVDGGDWDDPIIEDPVTMTSLEAKTVSSAVHTLGNTVTVDATVTLDTECTPTGDGCNELVNKDKITTEYVLDNTGGTCGGGSPTCEKRIHIRAEDVGVTDLNSFGSMSWDAYVVDGYLPHVDVFLENGEVLVFEYAKVQTPFDNSPYPTESLNTFDVKGIVDNTAGAWISSGCSGGDYMVWFTLSDWKSGMSGDITKCDGSVEGQYDISGSTGVIGFEIEVDNWMKTIPGHEFENIDANSNVWDIVINDVDVDEVTVLAGDELDFQIVTDFPKMMLPDIYTLTTTVEPVA